MTSARDAGRLRRWVAGLVVLVVTVGALHWEGTHRRVPLHQVTAGRDDAGRLVQVSAEGYAAGGVPLPGDRVAASLAVSRRAAQEAAEVLWLESGWLPPAGSPHEDLARDALRDLRALTSPAGTAPGSVLAGPSSSWRYVWPRDASFVAVAYARTGHPQDAVAVLRRLGELQAADGSLQARYLPGPDGGVPDGRPPQEDGPGWALWAVREVVAREPSAAPVLAPLATRSAARLLGRLDPATGLPFPSPDYWERPEEDLTLAVAAASLMGLDAAASLTHDGTVPPEAWAAAGVDPAALAPAADALRARIVQEFGPDFPRHVGGRPDAAVTFLLPPFVPDPVPGVDAARLRSQDAQRRPAGGLAPGAGWRPDGVSWTPQTALQALAAHESGQDREADAWLDWLDRHRTVAGSLPEKVAYDGRPGSVAPLAWTAAIVLITLAP